MSTAGFALAFHTLLLRLRVLILNPTFYHQFRPRRSSRCSPPAWTSRQDGLCLILYTFQFHHSATILGPPICTCCLTQSQETQNPRLGLPPRTRSQRVTTEWLPKDFPSNVTPKGSIWMWVLRVKGVMGRTRGGYSCSESEVSMRWGVLALGFLCKWHCSGLGQSTYEYPTWASKDILGLGANIHFYFPFESYSTVWAYLVTSWWRQPVAKLVTGQPYSQRIWWAYSLH